MVRASVVGAVHDPGAAYEMYDVASLEPRGARLIGPLLLEIGEEVTLRIDRDGRAVDIRARVTAVERGEQTATVFAFAEALPPATV